MSKQDEIIEVCGKKVVVRYSDKIFCTMGCALFKEGSGCQYGVDKCCELDIWNGGYTAEKYAYFIPAEEAPAELEAEIDREVQKLHTAPCYDELRNFARHFAEWGAEHLKR